MNVLKDEDGNPIDIEDTTISDGSAGDGGSEEVAPVAAGEEFIAGMLNGLLRSNSFQSSQACIIVDEATAQGVSDL